MDKLQKHDYMNTIEGYLEENQVYELFEDLLKQLVVARPENPLDFITEALSCSKSKPLIFAHSLSNLARRVFIMGPPGS